MENGNTILNGIIIDITREENYNSQLKEVNLRYEYLSKATHEMIWELQLNTGKIKLSGAYREILAIDSDINETTFAEWKKALQMKTGKEF